MIALKQSVKVAPLQVSPTDVGFQITPIGSDMSDNYIIETHHGAAGLVVRDRLGFVFFSATREFDVLDGKSFASPQHATAAAIRQSTNPVQHQSQ
ncbi:hypothetical protein [Bradyrhizobium sp. dw_411]|uniref:hypothetical protein n=1 Tax=Bradyrhizobium sp. dw_411 TaxID=2720082 RepID=UPI0031FF01FF